VNRLMGLIAAAGVAMSMFSAGTAGAQGAPDVTGQKYSEAAAALRSAGFTARLAAKVGDQLSQNDCVVSSQAVLPSTSSFGPAQFNGGGSGNIVMLSLNCDGAIASAIDPGYSAASSEGRAAKAKQTQENVKWQMTPVGQKWCAESKIRHPEWGWEADPGLAGCRSGG
jgi:PASTA domain